jgi:hypothetical protein
MLCPSWGESKAKKLAAVVELANAEGSEADVSPDMHDREFLRRHLRLSEGEVCADHAPDAWDQGVPGKSNRIQAGVSHGIQYGKTKMRFQPVSVGVTSFYPRFNEGAFKLVHANQHVQVSR